MTKKTMTEKTEILSALLEACRSLGEFYWQELEQVTPSIIEVK